MEPSFKQEFQAWLNPMASSKKGSFNIVIDVQFVSKKLLKQLVALSKTQTQIISREFNKQVKCDLNNNQTFKNSIDQFSMFLMALAYNHNNSSIFKIKNLVGFFSIGQTLVNSTIIQQKFREYLNRQVVNTMFSQPLHSLKQIYSKTDQSKFLRTFTHSFQTLIQKRITIFTKTFGLNNNLIQLIFTYIKFFLEKQNIGESNRIGNHNEEVNLCQKMVSQISIDMILLSSVYLMYKRKEKRIRFSSMLLFYKQKISNKKMQFTGIKLLEFYNNFMIKCYTQKKLNNINKNSIQIDENISNLMTCESIENQSSVLDNYMSSLEN